MILYIHISMIKFKLAACYKWLQRSFTMLCNLINVWIRVDNMVSSNNWKQKIVAPLFWLKHTTIQVWHLFTSGWYFAFWDVVFCSIFQYVFWVWMLGMLRNKFRKQFWKTLHPKTCELPTTSVYCIPISLVKLKAENWLHDPLWFEYLYCNW